MNTDAFLLTTVKARRESLLLSCSFTMALICERNPTRTDGKQIHEVNIKRNVDHFAQCPLNGETNTPVIDMCTRERLTLVNKGWAQSVQARHITIKRLPFRRNMKFTSTRHHI